MVPGDKVYGRVYLVTNNVTGKKYVGQTVKSLDERWRGHVAFAKAGRRMTFLAKSIAHHGPESFSIRLLCEVHSREELDKQEIRMIRQLGTLAPAGYNLTEGGLGSGGYYPSDETLAKRSVALKGRVFSDEHRASLSKALSGVPMHDSVKAQLAKPHQKISYDGELWSLRRLHKERAHPSVSYPLFTGRVKNGWPLTDALLKPMDPKRRKRTDAPSS
jgi:group I intron endonuclease